MDAIRKAEGGHFANLPMLAERIVISGGNTLFPGFAARIRHELIERRKEKVVNYYHIWV
jgi:actin-related protein